MPVARMRMRPWLENMLDSNAIPGLVWLDKEKMLFSIPWKHAARHGWDVEKDACIFKLWAKHTGKFKAEMTRPDPKTWKANFRCALNSLPDIAEVKTKSVNKGCGAMRVYQMLETAAKKKDKRSRGSGGKSKSKKVLAAMDDYSVLGRNTKQSEDVTVEADSTEPELPPDSSVSQYSTDEECSSQSSSMGTSPYSTNMYPIQVSPVHSVDFESEQAVLELELMCEQDGDSFFSPVCLNHVEENDCWSPGSSLSDSDLSERLYTELGGSMSDEIDNVPLVDFNVPLVDWNSSNLLQLLS